VQAVACICSCHWEPGSTPAQYNFYTESAQSQYGHHTGQCGLYRLAQNMQTLHSPCRVHMDTWGSVSYWNITWYSTKTFIYVKFCIFWASCSGISTIVKCPIYGPLRVQSATMSLISNPLAPGIRTSTTDKHMGCSPAPKMWVWLTYKFTRCCVLIPIPNVFFWFYTQGDGDCPLTHRFKLQRNKWWQLVQVL
jgi:hypothetical protein